MESLNFPPVSLSIVGQPPAQKVFDRVRRRWVALTPEEWVRQHLIHFLIDQRGYSPSLITVEAQVQINRLRKRVDVVCYQTGGLPWLVAECKAPQVALSQKVLDQVLRYNLSLCANYILITNGKDHFCYQIEREGVAAAICSDIPFAPPVIISSIG